MVDRDNKQEQSLSPRSLRNRYQGRYSTEIAKGQGGWPVVRAHLSYSQYTCILTCSQTCLMDHTQAFKPLWGCKFTAGAWTNGKRVPDTVCVNRMGTVEVKRNPWILRFLKIRDLWNKSKTKLFFKLTFRRYKTFFDNQQHCDLYTDLYQQWKQLNKKTTKVN